MNLCLHVYYFVDIFLFLPKYYLLCLWRNWNPKLENVTFNFLKIILYNFLTISNVSSSWIKIICSWKPKSQQLKNILISYIQIFFNLNTIIYTSVSLFLIYLLKPSLLTEITNTAYYYCTFFPTFHYWFFAV